MKNPEEMVLDGRHWFAVVSDDQAYLGRLVLVLKRACGDLAEVRQGEWLEFEELVPRIQNALKKTFSATMFNWCCLMNNAYQEADPDPQVHWHFRPRYDHPVEFDGQTFTDPNFGYHYLREDKDKFKVDPAFRKKLAQKIRENI